MARLDGTPRRRILLSKGQLVASTNRIQNACARSLKIIHVYRELTHKRLRRYVEEN
jgi:hypothetical protein